MSELKITNTSTVTEDRIDHLGHMNVRWYAADARAGTEAFIGALGADLVKALIVDVYTRHHRERMLGEALKVRTGAIGIGDGHLRLYHELSGADDDDVGATFVHTLRWPADLPTELDTIDVPERGQARSIPLDTDPLRSTPTLETVRDLDLAMRTERTLTTEDTGGDDHVPLDLAAMLIWGGEGIGGGEPVFFHKGADGETIGMATMETRLSVGHLPAAGTRIQSFSATTSIAEKTSRMTSWAFDVDSGDVLVSFDVVDLAFDIDRRRSVPMPPTMRADAERRFHPALAPR